MPDSHPESATPSRDSAPVLDPRHIDVVRQGSRDDEACSRILEALAECISGPSDLDRDGTERRVLEALLESSELLWLEIDSAGCILRCNEGWAELTGTDAATWSGRTAVDALASADDRAYVASRLDDHFESARSGQYELVVEGADGSPRTLRWAWLPVEGDDGTVDTLIAVGFDVTLMKKMELKLHETSSEIAAILHSFPDLTLRVDREGRVLALQGGSETSVIEDPEELLGYRVQDVLPDDVGREFGRAFQAVFSDRPSARFEYACRVHGQRRDVEARIVRLPGDQAFVILRDISDRERAKRSLEQLVAGTGSVTGEAFLTAVVQHLAAALETSEAFLAECRTDDPSSMQIVSAWGPRTRQLIGTSFCGPLAEAICDVPSVYATNDVRTLYGDRSGLPRAIDCVVASPLRTPSGKIIGLVGVFDRKPIAQMARARSILEIFAARTAAELSRMQAESKLEEARAQEVALGAHIQRTLLTGSPPEAIEGVSLAVTSIPSQQIDGDFYDFIEYAPKLFDVIVGDVMGKGVPAALVGAATRSHFVRVVSEMLIGSAVVPTPERIVTRVNEDLAPELIAVSRFVTACYARFDLRRHLLTFVDCGHTKTVHYRAATSACELLEGENVPLGFVADETYREAVIGIEDGDRLLFYSDCVTETRSPDGELFGENRLCRLLRYSGALDPDVFVHALQTHLLQFSQSSRFEDDFTCLAVRVGKVDDDGGARPRCLSRVSFRSDLRYIEQWRAELARFIEAHAAVLAGTDFVASLQLALNEVVVNVIKHGYSGASERDIDGTFAMYADRIEFRIEHDGVPIDRDAVREPSFDGSRSGGFGVFIVDQVMDEVEYSTALGRSRIRLAKFWERGEKA